jgi:hypothetical protein
LKAGVQSTKHPFQCNIFFKVFGSIQIEMRNARIHTDSTRKQKLAGVIVAVTPRHRRVNAPPPAHFPNRQDGRLPNRRRGVAITFCDGGVAAIGKPISVFRFKGHPPSFQTRLDKAEGWESGRNRKKKPATKAWPA